MSHKNLKPTKEQHIFSMTKKGIGVNLCHLRMIKKYPDNYDKNARQRALDGLKTSMYWYHKMLKDNPALKGAEQMSLNLEMAK